MESFYSIQGEGVHVGKPAYFIRLSGCDVNCHWCDVKGSWKINKDQYKTVEQLVQKTLEHPSDVVIITGGEPLMHDLTELTQTLKKHNKKTHLETSGTHPLTGDFDWICFSPKKFKKPLDDFFEISDEIKFIIYNDSDFNWAEDLSKSVKNNPQLILQPEWSKYESVNPKILSFIKSNPKWRISLQTHKYLNIE